MTTPADYLATFAQSAAERAPSITMTTVQRNPLPAGVANWKPGIVGYGWGVNGQRSGADPDGLRFGLNVWFSDRGQVNTATPDQSAHFRGQVDQQRITLAPDGPDVVATVELVTWGVTFTARSLLFEESTQQLIFDVPGAGPAAPRALMIVSMHPTGALNLAGDHVLNPV